MHVQKTALSIASVLGMSLALYSVNQSLNSDVGIAFQISVSDGSLLANSHSLQQSKSADFTPPNRGTPGPNRTGSAGTRDDCGNWEIPLVTLVPSEIGLNDEGVRSQSILSLTAESHPVFWFYLPDLPADLTHVDFRLQDEDQTYIYEDKITIESTHTAQIVGFRLPETQPALTPGTPYMWIVSVTCNPNDPAPSAEAWIERTTPLPEASDLPPAERVKLYGDNGLLNEFTTDLAWLRRNQPDQYEREWIKFLDDINLSAISGELNIQFPE